MLQDQAVDNHYCLVILGPGWQGHEYLLSTVSNIPVMLLGSGKSKKG
jgi:hypothetical protein